MIREINGKEYTFKLTRKGVRKAEQQGLSIDTTKPLSMVYGLWFAALMSNHPMPVNKAEDLLDDYLDQDDCPETIADITESLAGEYGSLFE